MKTANMDQIGSDKRKCRSKLYTLDYRHNGNERPAPGFEFATVALETRMPRTGSLPTIVPRGADQTVYLVVDSFGANSAVYRETEVEQIDLETIIGDLISGQLNDAVHPLASIGLNFGLLVQGRFSRYCCRNSRAATSMASPYPSM